MVRDERVIFFLWNMVGLGSRRVMFGVLKLDFRRGGFFVSREAGFY